MEKMQRNRIIVMSIMSYYARQIFDETKGYEFRKSPLKAQDLDKKNLCILCKRRQSINWIYESFRNFKG